MRSIVFPKNVSIGLNLIRGIQTVESVILNEIFILQSKNQPNFQYKSTKFPIQINQISNKSTHFLANWCPKPPTGITDGFVYANSTGNKFGEVCHGTDGTFTELPNCPMASVT